METRLEHPEALAGFKEVAAVRARIWTWAMMALWLLVVNGDWVARFRNFRWQDQLWISGPGRSAPAQGSSGYASQLIAAHEGAGLTRMVPVKRVAARYSEYHPEYVRHVDPRGYVNEPLPENATYPIVMLGDSFMVSLGTQTVAQALAAIAGVPVYNHGRAAAGPFQEVEKYILSDSFNPLPRVLVWNLSARELGAPLFLRQPIEAWFAGIDVWRERGRPVVQGRIQWRRLAANQLSTAWPNTSLMAYLGRQGWAQAKLLVFREWPADVLGADDPQFGPMLFYRHNLRMLPMLTPGENAQDIVNVVSRLAERFRERGETLVIMLVPEKEQIHIRALPITDQEALAEGPALLSEIENGLAKAGVPVVNLMPVFQDATASGTRLYWRDDTHWNDDGIRLAAEELWKVVEPLLGGKSGDRGDPRSEVRGPGSVQTGDRDRGQKDRDPRSEVRSPGSVQTGDRKTEIRGPKSDVRRTCNLQPATCNPFQHPMNKFRAGEPRTCHAGRRGDADRHRSGILERRPPLKTSPVGGGRGRLDR